MKIIKNNHLPKGACLLQHQFGVYIDGNNTHTYLCKGNTLDEALDYFMLHWGNKAKHTIEVFYNYLPKKYLQSLSLAC